MPRPEQPASAAALPPETPVFVAPAHWRAIDFISDLHLASNTPRALDAWAAHLRHTRADAVFILGDLFEAWVGDDVAEGSFESGCIAVLRAAAKRRAIAFMAGNRDFLVGDALLRSIGVMRLTDPTIIEAFGVRLLASHGDALCLGDTAYQRYRRLVRRPGVQRFFLSLPRSVRERVGRALRGRGGAGRQMPYAFVDLDAEATASWIDAAGSHVLVHGHTHAPASHAVGAAGIRHVMTDWHLDDAAASRAGILRWHDGGIERIAPETAASSQASAT